MPKSDALHYNPCPNAWTRQLDEARAATSPFTAEHKDALEQQQSDDRLDPTVNIQPNHSPADSLTVNPTASAAMEGPGGGGGGGGNVQAEAEHGKCNGHGADEGDWRCASWDDERMPPALEPPGTAAPADVQCVHSSYPDAVHRGEAHASKRTSAQARARKHARAALQVCIERCREQHTCAVQCTH